MLATILVRIFYSFLFPFEKHKDEDIQNYNFTRFVRSFMFERFIK
jgi:hypothetical protein